jgi:50S ribosomal protein L16 3-hydroxylase
MTATGNRVQLPAGIDRSSFLRDYWQQRPLLMRAALPPALFALGPEELAGLACEPEFESRLVQNDADGHWTLRHGPFGESDFAGLPETDWTLLVQDVDKYLPEVAAVIDWFDFVPGWRIDDVMISYAADGGGVGPHVDAYDVFLMQAQGRRRWRLSHRDYTDADLLPDSELRVLAQFDVDDEWVLAPGDVLYLPPGVAHWGIAEGDCMTWSLGFRSPDQRELAADWFAWLIEHEAGDERRLVDPGDLTLDDPGCITHGAVAGAARLVDALPDTASDDFRRWLGCHFTESKPQFLIERLGPRQDRDAVRNLLREGHDLQRHPFARAAWTALTDGRPVLFCQGKDRVLPHELVGLVRLLAARRCLANDVLRPLVGDDAGALDLLAGLLDEGILEVSAG